MKCEVERFERGTNLTIKDWINQMENYFTIGQVPPDAFVGFMLVRIVPKRLNKIGRCQSLGYLEFREKLVEIFEEPHMATAYLNALSSLSQTREESISDYMLQARLLVIKARPNLARPDRERVLVASFLIGLYDRQLAASLAVARIQNAADAERLAIEGEAVRHDRRSRRCDLDLLLEGAIIDDSGDSPGADLEPLDEVEEELTAAIGSLVAARRPDSRSGGLLERRKSTSATKCYGCGQYGHFKADCPRPVRPPDRRFTPRPSLEFLLCNGNHFVRDCPLLASAKSLLRRETGRDTDSSKSSVPRPSTANESN